MAEATHPIIVKLREKLARGDTDFSDMAVPGLAARVLHQIEEHPETWDQSSFGYGATECGTALCAGGWAVKLLGLSGASVDTDDVDILTTRVAKTLEQIPFWTSPVPVIASIALGARLNATKFDAHDDPRPWLRSLAARDAARGAPVWGPRLGVSGSALAPVRGRVVMEPDLRCNAARAIDQTARQFRESVTGRAESVIAERGLTKPQQRFLCTGHKIRHGTERRLANTLESKGLGAVIWNYFRKTDLGREVARLLTEEAARG